MRARSYTILLGEVGGFRVLRTVHDRQSRVLVDAN